MAMVFPTSPIVGQVFTSGGRSWVWNGSTWDSPARDNPTIVSGLQQVLYYTSSGTFTKATYPWLRAIRVKVQGAGGGSGGCSNTGSSQISAGGSGSGGGYGEKFITNIAGLSASETITIGAGGAGGAVGNNGGGIGGNSVAFGITASGGNGGAGMVASSVAFFFPIQVVGGGSSGGDENIPGSSSIAAIGLNVDRVQPSVGGGSRLGGFATDNMADSAGRPAKAGLSFGGGAGGGAVGQNGTGRAGAAGANGIVIVELYA